MKNCKRNVEMVPSAIVRTALQMSGFLDTNGVPSTMRISSAQATSAQT